LRENLSFESTITSDTATLHGLVAAMLAAALRIHCIEGRRQAATRGIAQVLSETWRIRRRW